MDSCWEDRALPVVAAWQLRHMALVAVRMVAAPAALVRLPVVGTRLEASALLVVRSHQVALGRREAQIRQAVPGRQVAGSHLEAYCRCHLEGDKLQPAHSHQVVEPDLGCSPCLDHRLKGDT